MRPLTAILLCAAHGCASPRAERAGAAVDAPVRVDLEPFAGGYAFDHPTDIQSPPRDDRVFVVEQPGTIRIVRSDGTLQAEPFLDVRALLPAGELSSAIGLFGLAFHPDFATNGRFFVNFNDGMAGVREFRVEPGAATATDCRDPDRCARGRILVRHSIPGDHNGGAIAFGPDGTLYVPLGDGACCDDPDAVAQDLGSPRGKILRIDVDTPRDDIDDPAERTGAAIWNFAVPRDNPFADRTGIARAIWAVGVRNPWRSTFDAATGDYYVADVGETRFDEIDVLPAGTPGGQNLGWPRQEGPECREAGGCSSSWVAPARVLPHRGEPPIACAVIGGVVYQGDALPELRGQYVYADLCYGWIRAFRYDRGAGQAVDDHAFAFFGPTLQNPTAFGKDARGEILLAEYGTGLVHRLAPPTRTPPQYQRLSGTGLYADIGAKVVAEEAVPFSPNSPLWSDGADKQRWIVLPPGSSIDTTDFDHWQMPVGTRLFKEFSTGGVRLETRMIERFGPGPRDYWMGSFVWLPDESDAVFVEAGAQNVRGSQHDVPSQETCWACHAGEPGRVLGFSAVQLSRPGGGTTLSWLSAAGRLSTLPPPGPDYAVPGDATTARALGWLHANCGHCHNPRGLAPVSLRMRLDLAARTPEETATYRTAIGTPLTYWREDPYRFRVVPGDPAASALLARIARRGEGQMPPIATERPDPDGVAAVTEWIASLRPAP